MSLNIVVVRGGPSLEYEVSLKSGAHILQTLGHTSHNVKDVVIDPYDIWHYQGKPVDQNFTLQNADYVVNAIHGEYGEDGKLQQLLELHSIPHSSSSSYASALSMNKALSKKTLAEHGIQMATSCVVRKSDFPTIISGELPSKTEIELKAVEIIQNFTLPLVVKPVSKGSSFGTTVAKSFHDLVYGIELAFNFDDAVLVEEFIPGKEASVGVIDGFRGQKHYALIPTEIRHNSKEGFFDLQTKYSDVPHLQNPGNFTQEESKELQRLAILAHTGLGLSNISRSDFILHPKRGIYFLETNSVPGMTEQSIFPHALASVGSNFTELLEHLISLRDIKK